VKRAASMVAM
jgi:hypothetical protein